MFPDEKNWIIYQIEENTNLHNGRVIDVGSGRENYRKIQQPHINELYCYLQKKGLKIEKLDIDQNHDIDHIFDITKSIDGLGKYQLVLCTNLLEHVNNIQMAIRNLEFLVDIGGYILVTVPHNLPPHQHPIDNLFRPNSHELAKLFEGDLLVAETFQVGHYKKEFITNPDITSPKISGVLLSY